MLISAHIAAPWSTLARVGRRRWAANGGRPIGDAKCRPQAENSECSLQSAVIFAPNLRIGRQAARCDPPDDPRTHAMTALAAPMSAPVSDNRPGQANRYQWSQTWRNVLFLHWEVPAGRLAELLPAELELDRWSGTTWVS